jgi:hypothetical protein
MNRKNLAETIQGNRQSGFIPVGVSTVNQSIRGGPVKQAADFAKKLNRFVFFRLGLKSLHGGPNAASFGAVSVAIAGRCSHPFDTIFMNWHLLASLN